MDEVTQPSMESGTLLAGKYRIDRVIGEGGMGVVIAAKHEALNTNVAIKLLRTAALGHTDIVGRFMREARAAVSLRSEHVARVFDVGTLEDGRPYIVMERLEGQDLGDVIDAGPAIPIQDAVDWVMQACEAIAEAHGAGIIHRDLKPKNLFLTRAVHGRPLVKVLDFGISKVDPAKSPGEMQLTKTAEIIGSPSYMSPEQLRSSRNVDARTDIWALGVILYELFTGRVPFHAETVTELVLVVVTEKEPPVQSLRPDLPLGLAAVVERCLEKNPDHRYQSVVDLVSALEPFAHGVQSSIADRVRGVARQSGPIPPVSGAPSSDAIPLVQASSRPAAASGAPQAVSSGRINVHGGTSVAWGETQSAVQAAPVLPRRRRAGAIAVGASALVLTVAIGTAAFLYTRRSVDPPPPALVAAKEGALPLPPGRKDLPPVVPPASAIASAKVPDPPIASALPETRKTVAAPAPPPVVTARPKPAASKDDLDNIGRR